jgi:large subunit ribosomal protein L10
MKKIGKLVKEISVNRIQERLKSANSVFVLKYSGLSSPDLSTLRLSLKGANAKLFVVRNKITRRSLEGLEFKDLARFIDGPCGFVFAKDEPVGVSKVLCDFLKTHEQMKLEGGALKDRILEKKDIEALAKLPSKEVLRAQVVGALNAPILKLVMVLNGNLRKVVCCLDQIKQKKGTPR